MEAIPDAEADPSRWYGTNLVGIPAPVIASTAFASHPRPLHIAGTRETNAGLFALLARSVDAAQARTIFAHYMTLAFGLTRPEPGSRDRDEARRWKASYLKLLQGWGLDSNGPAAAVLKGWAESRFGIVPVFHKEPLARFPSPGWLAYLEEKSSSRFHNNNIQQQLDLLFEFCQWMLARFRLFGEGSHVVLWRGSTRCEEQIVSGNLRKRRCVVRLNNIVSFSLSREEAECFGDWILEARIPLSKLIYVPGLLDTASLRGEAEVVALGGSYEMRASYE